MHKNMKTKSVCIECKTEFRHKKLYFCVNVEDETIRQEKKKKMCDLCTEKLNLEWLAFKWGNYV